MCRVCIHSLLPSSPAIFTQSNHFELALSNSVHMLSDFLEHRNVPDDVAARIVDHIKYASQRAVWVCSLCMLFFILNSRAHKCEIVQIWQPHQYAFDQWAFLPRALRQPLMSHLVNQQVCSCNSSMYFLCLSVFLSVRCEVKPKEPQWNPDHSKP